jgi:hypothetical protein
MLAALRVELYADQPRKCNLLEKCISMKRQQAHMHQNLLNAEFASGEYRNAGDKNMPVFGVMKALTKVLHKCFCCIHAYCQLHFLGLPEKCISMKGRQAHMHQNLLNAEFAFGEYQNARDKNMPVFGVMKALAKELHKSFYCTYACRHFIGILYSG